MFRFTRLASVVLALALSFAAASQDAEPYPRISREAYEARLPFFDYDKEIPLEARVVREWKDGPTVRQKFVFRGAQGFLVPGYLEWPAESPTPRPVVMLLHGWSGGKENWYEEGNYINGGEMRKAVLESGFAVMAIDACTHGERSNEIDYQHVNAFDDPAAPKRVNYFTFAEIATQTIKDHRRALDYLAGRGEFDMTRVGLAGYSMGGMNSIFLLACEPRIKMAVACVPPLLSIGYGPMSPVDFTWGIGDKPFLMLMGTQDTMYEGPKVDASYKQYIESPNSKLIWYDRDHKLTEIYIPDAINWIKAHL